MTMDDSAISRFLSNIEVRLGIILDQAERALAPKRRGPTPCSTCRWFLGPEKGGEGLCTGNGTSKLSDLTSAEFVGCAVSTMTQAIGCPKHEERT